MRNLVVACATMMLVTLALISPAGSAAPCSSASGCEFWDGNYHEYLLYDWTNTEFDVLILPPASMHAPRDLETLRGGVVAWREGIEELGPSWLSEGIEIKEYVLGVDDVPPEVLADPEIVIVSGEFNPFVLFGIGLASPVWYCLDNLIGTNDGHQHEGSIWQYFRVDCNTPGGDTCFVVNTNFLAFSGVVVTVHGGDDQGMHRMFDLNTHEFGHCLGAGHVGDALDFDAKSFPVQDIMSYQFDASQVHCVSTLNIKALAALYADDLPGADVAAKNAGGYVHMHPSQYDHVDCDNPIDSAVI